MNKYDLEERTAKFGENIIIFCQSVKINTINRSLINQIIRSGTSVGANYCEANNASSRKDFRNKIYISKKELQETKYWLRMIGSCCGENIRVKGLKDECQELILIFQKITITLDKNKDN